MPNFKEVIIMSKKDDKKNSQNEEPENVYGEIKETDPTVLNDEYEFGGGGSTSDEQTEIVEVEEIEEEESDNDESD